MGAPGRAPQLAAMLPGVAAAKDDGKSDCKKGGWRDLVTADGRPFADQGECVGYVGNGGTPHPPETVVAIAYSDLNGTDGFQEGSADVLISRLVDLDGNGRDAGDRIDMGRYPTSLSPTGPGDFADWGVDSHVVASVYQYTPGVFVWVRVSASHLVMWTDQSVIESWGEGWSGASHPIRDVIDQAGTDLTWVDTGSPSQSAFLPARSRVSPADDVFVDTEVH